MAILRRLTATAPLLLALLCLVAPACRAATELVADPHFQQISGNMPRLWGHSTFNTPATVSLKSDADGRRCLSLRNETIDSCSDVATYGSKLSLPKGTLLRFSGWYRTENLVFGEKPLFYGQVDFNTRNAPNRFSIGSGPLKPAGTWTRFEQTVPLKKDVESFDLVMLFFRCKGELLLRDISLQVVSPQDSLVLFSLKRKPPAVDGKLDDDCWKGAQRATGFLPLGKVEPAPADTEVMSAYDDTTLYLAVRLHEPHLAALKVHPGAAYGGDCVELFLDPAGQGRSFFHVIVDSAGNRYTGVNDGTEKPAQLEMTARSGRFPGGWTAEVAIPFAALNATLPKDNERWGFNAGRERYAVSPQENTSWAPLGTFFQRERFGRLAFYSRAEVVADMAYWEKSDADPLMRKPAVSGFEVASLFAGVRRLPTLWNYDPFGAQREKHAAWKCRGLSEQAREKYPEFNQAGMGLNRLLVEKAMADDLLANLRRQLFWYAAKRSEDGLEAESGAVDAALNDIYQAYGKAFDDGWNKDLLAGLDERIAAAGARITALRKRAAGALAQVRADQQKRRPWKAASLRIPPAERLLNGDGVSQRYSFSSYAYAGDRGPFSLLGAFESVTLGWPSAIPKQPAPGQYVYEYLDQFFSKPKKPEEIARGHVQVTFALSDYWVPLSPALEEKAKSDPDLLLRSQDGLTGKKVLDWGAAINLHNAGNPNNPELLAYTQDYLKNLAAHVAPAGKMDFFLTAWEAKHFFYARNEKGESVPRSLGYNESGKQSFRAYLQERYGSVAELNRRWGSAYASFAAVEPPPDKYVRRPESASGLAYEFERWSRVNHARYLALLRRSLKAGAPRIPVMTDDSTVLAEMNGYLLFRENAADIFSFHMNPSSEEALWTYLSTMRRKFGKELGYYENYWQMHTSGHLQDERLAQRDVRKLFFDLLTHDIRTTTWWLSYMGHPTEYAVAYGGGQLGFDYDQTILRWSAAGLAPMFSRCRALERALVESAPEAPKSAIVQPCTSIYTLASLGKSHLDSPAIQEMLAAHYRMLAPGSYPHDYLPEEMVLDGRASLNDYALLVLPYAPYLTEAFSRRLTEWVRRGGTLIAVGPFALQDECGRPLPAGSSLCRALFPGIRKEGAGDWDYRTDGRPAEPGMVARPYGQGSLVYLNRAVDVYYRNPALAGPLRGVLARAGQRTASSPTEDLQIAVRKRAGGGITLCLCNRNVEAPLTATVSVRGSYRQAFDVQIPGWCPVPLEVKGGHTLLNVRLDAGDWTILQLLP